MYSTRTAITMSLKDILDKVNDLDIYTYCLGQFKVGKLMNSPLRSGDKNPSFGIFHSKTGGLLWKDLGTGECGNSLKFLKEYKGITTREELERELLRIVRRINPNTIVRTNTYDKPKGDTDIGIVRQPFTNVDKQYWKQFGIHINTLKSSMCLALNTFFVIVSSEVSTKKIVLCMHIKCMISLRFIVHLLPSLLNGVPI